MFQRFLQKFFLREKPKGAAKSGLRSEERRGKMSVIDILTRVDVLCKKYEKYDLDKQRATDLVSGQDQFVKLYSTVEADIEASLQVLSTLVFVAGILNLT